jgi:hypothetical protein
VCSPKFTSSKHLVRGSTLPLAGRRYNRKLWIEDFSKSVVYLPLQVVKRKSRRANVGGKDTPMHSIRQDEASRQEEFMLDLDEIVRVGARRMLAQALEAEVEAYLQAATERARRTRTCPRRTQRLRKGTPNPMWSRFDRG